MFRSKMLKAILAIVMTLAIIQATVPVATLAASATPKPPNGIKATAVGTTSIKLTWKKASGANRYIVYQKAGSKYVQKTETKANSYAVKKLKAGTKYTFAIASKSGNKIGKKSKVISCYTLCAAPKISSVTPPSSSSIKASWKKVAGAGKYIVYMSTSAKGTYKKAGETKKLNYTIKKLKANTTYYIKVSAINGDGKAGAKSAYKSAKTGGKPTPTQPSATATATATSKPTPKPTSIPTPTPKPTPASTPKPTPIPTPTPPSGFIDPNLVGTWLLYSSTENVYMGITITYYADGRFTDVLIANSTYSKLSVVTEGNYVVQSGGRIVRYNQTRRNTNNGTITDSAPPDEVFNYILGIDEYGAYYNDNSTDPSQPVSTEVKYRYSAS